MAHSGCDRSGKVVQVVDYGQEWGKAEDRKRAGGG